MKPHCAVGFPAGTGLAHNFINNTDKDVELLVLGERTKKENLCSFPVNPEQKDTCNIWWSDAPTRSLGPHNGKPGPIDQEVPESQVVRHQDLELYHAGGCEADGVEAGGVPGRGREKRRRPDAPDPAADHSRGRVQW